jgi:RNA polymerase sigma-70 factor, ECF subfamily
MRGRQRGRVKARRDGPPPVGADAGADTGPGADDADAEFVRAVYAEHGDALLGYARHLTGDRTRAEDVVQETVLRAWQHAARLRADGRALRPWLFTVATRLVIDAHRARAARPREVGDAVLASVPGNDDVERALETWQVAEAVRTLRPDHRAALVETYYRGRSVAEAAAALGIPAGTVKSRVYYALRALRLTLEEQGWTP